MCSVSHSCSRKMQKESQLLWTLLKLLRGSRYCISSVTQQPSQMVKTIWKSFWDERHLLLSAGNLEVRTRQPHLAAAPKSMLHVLDFHLPPVLKVAGLALSCPQSILLPSSTLHKALCEMGTVPRQTSLRFQTKHSFHSISCTKCSCSFRRG